MAAMDACTTAPDPFTLNYRKQTPVSLFRKGLREEPIARDDLTRRCRTRSEWQLERERMYRERNSEGRRNNLRPAVDFILDDKDGQILPEESSGFSTYNSIDNMASYLKKNLQFLWEMPQGTPFPSEMNIFINQTNGHASIKPASKVSLERFAKMLNCLHWVKVNPQKSLPDKSENV